MFDFSTIKADKKESSPIDPIDIFLKNKSKITDNSINDLWLGQGDALREWHQHRNKEDVALVLNTGAGKTLIGLLIAQSLVNETKGKVIYACASIQLIEQTIKKADGYGIKATTYHNKEFSNNLFHRCESACITTYQALFNGRSIFRKEDIAAIIFDDAHTANAVIKSHFSIEISRDSFAELYGKLVGIFYPYFKNIGRAGTFQEILDGHNHSVELLPPSEIKNNSSEIHRLLLEY